MSRLFLSLAPLAASLFACGPVESPERLPQSLVLAMAVLGENEDGSPKPLPARAGILTREGGEWRYRFFEDEDSNVFHKVMPYGTEGLLTLGGSKAAVKLWRPDGKTETLWEADFGGKFSRMRDAEVADLYGDGSADIAVATHDQGVVAVLRPAATVHPQECRQIDGGNQRHAVDPPHRPVRGGEADGELHGHPRDGSGGSGWQRWRAMMWHTGRPRTVRASAISER